MDRQYRNITYLSDRSGTGVWRRIFHMNILNCTAAQTNIQSDYSQTPILDQNYYKGVNSVTVQRWIAPSHREIFMKLIKPIMDQQCGWAIYEIDDLMFDGTLVGTTPEHEKFLKEKYGDLIEFGIPLFNRGRAAFEGKEVQENIRTMLNAADFVLVTTDYIKNAYHDVYGVPLQNIVALPNLLPRYIFDNFYRPAERVEQFRKLKSKPRIGIISSLSHYNVDNVRRTDDGRACRKQKKPDNTEVWVTQDKQEIPENQTRVITDDIDEILDCIRSTVNEFQWVFFGYCPPKLQDLVKAGKIEVHGGVQIVNYFAKVNQLNLQAVVAPIAKTGFNFCKSFIKYMECAAAGIPCFATNCLPYSRKMPETQLFNDGADLKEKLLKLKYNTSVGSYQKIIEQQWKWLNSPDREGDFQLRNYWAEDNINIYMDLNKLRQKEINVSLGIFSKSYENRKKQEAENTIYKNDNIRITK